MTDEAFHLTPLDIRRFDFGSAIRGYDRGRVDTFRDQAANEVERLVRQCQTLEAKAQGFHEQLRAFRERDKAINEALVSAQQLRTDVREQAEREAQLILREAKAEAERIVAVAQSDIRKLEGELESLVRQRRAYLAQLRTMVERHLSEIEAAEASATMMPPPRAASTAAPAASSYAPVPPAPVPMPQPAPAPQHAPVTPVAAPGESGDWFNGLERALGSTPGDDKLGAL